MWQDDLRFGAAMLVIVIAINVALMLWLPHLHHASDISSRHLTAYTGIPASSADYSPVTLYASPAPAPEPTVPTVPAAAAPLVQTLPAPDATTTDIAPPTTPAVPPKQAPVVHILSDGAPDAVAEPAR